jgi:hypothetical protein
LHAARPAPAAPRRKAVRPREARANEALLTEGTGEASASF